MLEGLAALGPQGKLVLVRADRAVLVRAGRAVLVRADRAGLVRAGLAALGPEDKPVLVRAGRAAQGLVQNHPRRAVRFIPVPQLRGWCRFPRQCR